MIPTFKIRCSAIGKIMGGALGKPTDKQLARIVELEKKQEAKPLTELQAKELADLIAKRDSPPQLQEGARTYCQQWLKEQLYGKKQEFSSKYTEKGTKCEPAAIDLLAEYMNYGMLAKNDRRYTDDPDIEGEPDIVLPEMIEEIKNSWSCFTFPLFATELPDVDYEYQVNGYMAVTGKKRAAVNYILIDAPEEIIDREALIVSRKAGFNEVDMELYDEVYNKMTYKDIPVELRVKRFEFERNDQLIATIRERVKLCREYIESIYTEQLQQIVLNKAA